MEGIYVTPLYERTYEDIIIVDTWLTCQLKTAVVSTLELDICHFSHLQSTLNVHVLFKAACV